MAFLGGILGIKHAGNLTTKASYRAKKCENLLCPSHLPYLSIPL